MMTTTMTMMPGSVIDGPNNNTIGYVDDAAVTLTDGSRPTLLREHEDWVNRPLV